MPRHLRPVWLIPLVVALLTAGCQSSSRSHLRSTPVEEETDAEMEQRVQTLTAFSKGILLSERDEPDAAYEQFAKVAELDPANEAIATDLARHYLQKNQPERAVEVLQRTADQPGTSGVILALLGDTLYRTGKEDRAIQAYEKALQATPTLLGAYQQLAAIYLQRKQPAKALEVLEQALKLTETTGVFWLNVSDLFGWYLRVESAEKDRAKADYRQALERAELQVGTDPAELVRLARGYMEVGDSAKSLALFEKVNDQVPKNPAIAASLAELLLREGKLAEAKQYLEILSKANPTSHMPWYFLGVIALQEDDVEEAQRLFERSIQLNPEFEPAYSDLAVSFLNQKKSDAQAALAVLQRGLTRFPTSFRLVHLSALAEMQLKQYDRSYTAFKKAEALAGDRADELLDYRFYFQVGAMLTDADRGAESESYLLKSLALNPDYDEALNHLGYTWAEKGKNLDRALEMIQKAVAAEPENPAYLDSLGWVLFQLKRPAEALPHLEKAAQLLEKPDATVYDHLGDVLAALGRKDEAQAAWKKALAIEPSPEVQKKLDASR